MTVTIRARGCLLVPEFDPHDRNNQRIPTSRLERIQATVKATRAEYERSARGGANAQAQAGSDTANDVDDSTACAAPQLLKIGCSVAFATQTDHGKFEWWAGRVQKMKARSNGKSGSFMQVFDPMLYDTAKAEGVKVICNWYNKCYGQTFTYDGPRDAKEYSLEYALGLLEFEPAKGKGKAGRVCLRDASQYARLNELLGMTKPSEKCGSKRTRGEEVLAAEDKRKREKYDDEELAPKKAVVSRAAGKRRATRH